MIGSDALQISTTPRAGIRKKLGVGATRRPRIVTVSTDAPTMRGISFAFTVSARLSHGRSISHNTPRKEDVSTALKVFAGQQIRAPGEGGCFLAGGTIVTWHFRLIPSRHKASPDSYTHIPDDRCPLAGELVPRPDVMLLQGRTLSCRLQSGPARLETFKTAATTGIPFCFDSETPAATHLPP